VVAAKSLVTTLFAALLVSLVAAPFALADDPTVRIDPQDQVSAKRALLRATDFGPGWRGGATKATKPTGPDCPGFDPKASDLVITGHAEASFDNPRAQVQVSVDVQLLDSPESVRLDFTRTIRPKLADCLASIVRRSTNHPASVHVERLDVPTVGSVSAHYRATVALSVSGKVVKAVSDFFFVGHGRMEYSLNVAAPARFLPQLVPFELDIARLLVRRSGTA
jgi:hypothetical protein